MTLSASQFELADGPTDAIAAVRFAPVSPLLLVASWDRCVYLYEIEADGSGGKLVRKFEHRAPVLDVAWGESENEAYTGGLDWDVRRTNLTTGEQTVLSTHGAGVRSLAYSVNHNVLVSGSWDGTLHIHRTGPDGDGPFATVRVPQKPFALAYSGEVLVVAMAARAVHVYEMETLLKAVTHAQQNDGDHEAVVPWQRRESSLKFMTRSVACMPDGAGYASSSIEGRVAVEWFNPSAESQARKYAFKCHRQPAQDGSATDVVYPVNALTFHPVYGTFASGGGDGVVALWDGLSKRRIRQYQRYPASVAALSFDAKGRWLAIAISSGFEDAKEPDPADAINKLIIRELSDGEAKGKDKAK